MNTRVNGQIEAVISVHDRGLLYGHAVFETICVVNQRPRLLALHLARLEAGAKRLGIPCSDEIVEKFQSECVDMSKDHSSAVLRLMLTMGEGGRGYQSPERPSPNRIVSLYPYPDIRQHHYSEGIHLGRSDLVLSQQAALGGLKHANRLEQVLARQHWQDDWQEALLFDQNKHLIEATSANVFARKGKQVFTPVLDDCGVAGVMRQHIIEHLKKVGYTVSLVSLSEADLLAADELLLCNSVIGVWPVKYYKKQYYRDFSLSELLLKHLISHEIIPNH